MFVAIERADGGVSVMDLVPGADPQAEVEKWAETADPAWLPVSGYREVRAEDVPQDRTFRRAWKVDGKSVAVDIEKARALAHDMRRAARAKDFAPHDEIIAKRIPGADEAAAEAARTAIRRRYDAMQKAIDAAKTAEDLKEALK